ncbi:MAG: class II aldolase/adducin family protein [Alphaproteobacteria bacterium]|nr:class II aldolase/adducin family protein [Alphaproteobacteria bacterium]
MTAAQDTELMDAQAAARQKLAAAYRIVDHLGWTETIYGHLTLRVPGTNHFLINPWGLRYDEVTASNLVEIDIDGNIVGPSNYPVNEAGFVIHSAVHAGRDDLHCVFHIHTTAGMAVAAQQDGLLPISIMATGYHGRVAYHDYEGPSLNLDERERLVASLGEKQVLILRNHGLLTAGATVEEAFILMFRLQRACEIQIAAQAGGSALTIPSTAVCEESARLTDDFLNGNDGAPAGTLEFASYVRLIDQLDPSYKH